MYFSNHYIYWFDLKRLFIRPLFQSVLRQLSSWFKIVEFETASCSITGTITFLSFTLRGFADLRFPSDQKVLTPLHYLSQAFVLSSKHQRLRQFSGFSNVTRRWLTSRIFCNIFIARYYREISGIILAHA